MSRNKQEGNKKRDTMGASKGRGLNDERRVRQSKKVKYREEREIRSLLEAECYNKTAGCPHKMTK